MDLAQGAVLAHLLTHGGFREQPMLGRIVAGERLLDPAARIASAPMPDFLKRKFFNAGRSVDGPYPYAFRPRGEPAREFECRSVLNQEIVPRVRDYRGPLTAPSPPAIALHPFALRAPFSNYGVQRGGVTS